MSSEDRHRALTVLCHRRAVTALREAAGPGALHLVGGAVRDRLLGRPFLDLDAVVDRGRGERVAERLTEILGGRLVRLGGDRFAAYRVVADHRVIDLWDRGDDSLTADLRRRDLTVNSIAVDAASAEIFDPLGGVGDLLTKRLRANGPTAFLDDPLRVLRLARLVAELPGFSAGPSTLRLARRAAGQLVRMAAERVRYELERLISRQRAPLGVALLAATDVYPGLWLGAPGSEATAGDSSGRAVRLLQEALRAEGWIARRAPELASRLDRSALRWTTTFLALPTAEPLRCLKDFRAVGYLPRQEAESVARLLRLAELPTDAGARRRFLNRAAELWPTALALAAVVERAAGHETVSRELEALVELGRREGDLLASPPRLLRGDEVAGILGIGRGPGIGEAMRKIEAAWVEGTVSTAQEARDLLRRLR